jgi:adenylylsulfate kinase-like enzyme
VTFILALTGPTGAGKSAVARLLATRLPECVNIEVDHVKMFIVSGYRYEEPDGIDQWRLLGTNLGMLGANYQKAGYNVFVNGFLTVDAWEELQRGVTLTHRVLLLPSLEVNLKRDDARPYEDWLGEDEVRKHHAFFEANATYFSSFTRIDSSNQTVEETAEALAALLPH